MRRPAAAGMLLAGALSIVPGCERPGAAPGAAGPAARTGEESPQRMSPGSGAVDAVTEPVLSPPGAGRIVSNGGGWIVVFTPDPDPIPLNTPFSLAVQVSRSGEDAGDEGISLQVDARMPEHRHGMVVRPAIERLGPGVFRVDGMLLHMPGYWELTFDIASGTRVERAQIALVID
ncbi:MAG: hypothetical protein KF817_06315 [Phycisphaeraceae bacterium]|nr:hypothetical protein [Phycisphaeraceae bacterium]